MLIFSLPEKGLAWGSATHAYIAKDLGIGITDPQMLYGAAAPDFFYDLRSPAYDYLSRQTHTVVSNLKAKAGKRHMDAFAFGFVSHNEKWGADYTAHKKGRTAKKGYVVTKAGLLTPKLLFRLKAALDAAGVSGSFFWAQAISSDLSHKLIETAIDLEITKHEDPSIGPEFLSAVQSASDTIPGILADSYGYALSRRLKIPREDANHIIAEAEADFRQLMVRYGEILSQEDSGDIPKISEEGAELLSEALKNLTGKDVVIEAETMQEFLNLATQEVQADYALEISSTISYLKKRKEISSFLKTILRKR